MNKYWRSIGGIPERKSFQRVFKRLINENFVDTSIPSIVNQAFLIFFSFYLVLFYVSGCSSYIRYQEHRELAESERTEILPEMVESNLEDYSSALISQWKQKEFQKLCLLDVSFKGNPPEFRFGPLFFGLADLALAYWIKNLERHAFQTYPISELLSNSSYQQQGKLISSRSLEALEGHPKGMRSYSGRYGLVISKHIQWMYTFSQETECSGFFIVENILTPTESTEIILNGFLGSYTNLKIEIRVVLYLPYQLIDPKAYPTDFPKKNIPFRWNILALGEIFIPIRPLIGNFSEKNRVEYEKLFWASLESFHNQTYQLAVDFLLQAITLDLLKTNS